MRKVICLCLCLLPFIGAAQDTIYYQGWEEEPGGNGLYGFEQYNNQTWAQQNVWARQGFTGVNAGQEEVFRLLNPNPFLDCSDSRFDSCVVADAANFAGANGAHIITGAVANVNTAQLNRRHTGYHTGPWAPQPLGSEGQTAASNVGLYSPKMLNNTDYTQVQVEFYFKVNGELNHDYGLFKYSLNGEAPHPPLQDGAENQSAPQDFWTTYEFQPRAAAELPYPIWTPNGDTIRFATINPVGSTVPGQLQGYVYPPGDPRAGNAMWMKASIVLPEECAGDTNLRFGFWWVNDNNGTNALTAFPALIVDDVRVIGYKFSSSEIAENIYCPGDPISVPFKIGEDFYRENIEGRETDLYAILTDSTGSFADPDTLGSFPISQLEFDAEEGVYYGTLEGAMPVNSPQLPIGGYRARVVAPNSGFQASVSPTVLSILPSPDYTIAPQDTTICQDDSVMLMIEEHADTYIWKRGAQIVKETYEPFYMASVSGHYTADAIINGCTVPADTSRVTVIPFADVTLNLPESMLEVCYGTNINPLQGGSPAGGTYFWYYEGGNGEEVRVTGMEFNSIRAGVRDHAIGYEYTDTTTGCATSAIDTLTVLPADAGSIEGADSIGLCVDQTATLTASNRSAFGYLWSTGDTTNSIVVDSPGAYHLDYLSANGCSFRSETVQVVAIPNKPAPPTLDENLEIGSTELSGTVFLAPLRPTFVYAYVNDVKVAETQANADGTWSITLEAPLEAGDRVYVRSIYDTNCDGVVDGNDILSEPSIAVLIIPEGPIKVPNGFSPNGDGFNDTWIVVEAIQYRFPEAELYVFNRWGNEVFYEQGYDNSWDGGNVPDGTYYYVLKLNDPRYQEPFKGYVTISR